MEFKVFIFCITFLGVFAIFVGVGQPFFTAYERRQYDVPEYEDYEGIYHYADLTNQTLSGTQTLEFTLGGWNVRLGFHIGDYEINIGTYSAWAVFTWGYNGMDWLYVNNTIVNTGYLEEQSLYTEDIDAVYAEYGSSNQSKFYSENSDTLFHVFFLWNTTTYIDSADAWDNDDLHIIVAINYDDVNTSFNVWNLIGGLFFWQLPHVHIILNVILSIPLWGAVGYLVTIFILKIIPFIG